MPTSAELAPTPVCHADPMLPVPFRILRTRKETHDTFTLELAPADPRGFGFLPGQFNMLYMFGTGEVPISISGDPRKSKTLIHTIRAVGSVTEAMQKLKAGAWVGVRGPFGTGWPLQRALGKDVLIAAGGLGLAPLRPAIYDVLSNRKNYGKVAILYGTRTPGDILFPKELERWRGKFDVDVQVTVDHAPPKWRGNVGVVTTLLRKASFDPGSTVAMVCGPEIMMRFVAANLRNCGVALPDIYISMERNMKCAIGFCGHCQFGPEFVCKDGPVFSYDRMQPLLAVREL